MDKFKIWTNDLSRKVGDIADEIIVLSRVEYKVMDSFEKTISTFS